MQDPMPETHIILVFWAVFRTYCPARFARRVHTLDGVRFPVRLCVFGASWMSGSVSVILLRNTHNTNVLGSISNAEQYMQNTVKKIAAAAANLRFPMFPHADPGCKNEHCCSIRIQHFPGLGSDL